jgi:oxepin-CoA hydrolase/3-oxo-5,6-dehydrosuberyl-CoA semialdehyde dehydrogenase
MKLESYVVGRWQSGRDQGVPLHDATTGEVIAEASSSGIDFAKVLLHARQVGGPALRRLTFHERASLLKAIAKHLSALKQEFYELSY